jgi:hypothetical protein
MLKIPMKIKANGHGLMTRKMSVTKTMDFQIAMVQIFELVECDADQKKSRL